MEGTIRIGTRGSRLARWQADWVADRLRRLDPSLRIDLVEIKTQGDRDRDSPLAAIGGTGLFTKEVQRALRDGVVDVAVHSLKDLPTEGPEELILAAVPAREDVADALIAPRYGTVDRLPQRARIGTGSPRRRAQLLCLRPDLQVMSVRGNVETRLTQVFEGRLDAVMLAWAGLRRLGLESHVTQYMDPSAFLPAVGQGALGIECMRDNEQICVLLCELDDPCAHRAIVAERATLAALGGGCALPMGAWARDAMDGEADSGAPSLAIDAAVFRQDGQARVAVAFRGPREQPYHLGCRVGQALRDGGAMSLLGPEASSGG